MEPASHAEGGMIVGAVRLPDRHEVAHLWPVS